MRTEELKRLRILVSVLVRFRGLYHELCICVCVFEAELEAVYLSSGELSTAGGPCRRNLLTGRPSLLTQLPVNGF